MGSLGIYFVLEDEKELPQCLLQMKSVTKGVVLFREGDRQVKIGSYTPYQLEEALGRAQDTVQDKAGIQVVTMNTGSKQVE